MASQTQHKYANKKKYSDCIIYLKDPQQTIKVYSHQYVLASLSNYFDALFTHNKKTLHLIEEGIKTFEIIVDNAEVARDIIQSFFGIKSESNLPKWKYDLEMIKCRDFFSLEIDSTPLYTLQVPLEGFELMMSVMSLLQDNNQIIAMINNNFPVGYNLNKYFSEEMIEILKNQFVVSYEEYGIIKSYNLASEATTDLLDVGRDNFNIIISNNAKLVVISHYYQISIWYMDSGEKVVINTNNRNYDVVISKDNTLICILRLSTIELWDTNTRTNVGIININGLVLSAGSMAISRDTKHVVHLLKIMIMGDYHATEKMRIYDVKSCEQILDKDMQPDIKMSLTNDTNIVIMCDTDGIKLLDIKTDKIIRTFEGNCMNYAIMSIDGNIVVSGEYSIKLWNAKNGQLIQTLDGHDDSRIRYLQLSSDNKILMSQDHNNNVRIWDTNSRALIKEIPNCNNPRLIKKIV